MPDSRFTNALINETSPYLLQHAHNPVQWYPWGPEALLKAREENKPILLSIGYSACHWCHVMAHESFEDETTAALMNEHFINIKVDREERPDIDKIYQTAQQLLTQRTGGWPLTMFLTPDNHIPFFGGTYFPPDSRYGLPGFRELLTRVAEFYQQERDAIDKQNESMQDALQRMTVLPTASTDEFDNTVFAIAVHQLEQSFDRQHGGFGNAPKFPHPTNLEYLLMQAVYTTAENESVQTMLEVTLDKMARGGVYDQLGGGFYRYSVDQYWMIPHFEKMLYDNGPLLTLYSQAWRLTGKPLYEKTARETADWVMREMQSPAGGYYSTLDADSEGHEGKFYVWDKNEIQGLLDEGEYRVFAERFGLNDAANFEGKWHLYVSSDIADDSIALLDQARHKLRLVRDKRIWPGRDEKILTSWNGLMIKGMATAACTFNNDQYYDSALRAVNFIQQTMWKNSRLLATCKDDKAHLNAYLDDYAFMIDGIISLLNYRWDRNAFDFALQLCDCLLKWFEDRDNGGFFFTSHDHEQLIQRYKPFMDDALPSGNGIACKVLLQLGHLTGNETWLQAAARTLSSGWHTLGNYPSAHTALLSALWDYQQPPLQVVLRGTNTQLDTWRMVCHASGHPLQQVFPVPADEADLPDLLAAKTPMDSGVAYICQGFSCHEPLTQLDLLTEKLNNPEA